WIVHLYWIGVLSGTSFHGSAAPGAFITHFSIFGTVWLYSPLLVLLQKKLCGTGAEFLTTMVSPTRAQVTRGVNMQHGWSITTSAGLRLASSGKICSGVSLDLGSVSSGRSQTTTFLTPLFFGLTITDSSSTSPLDRQWSLSWVTLSGSRLGI